MIILGIETSCDETACGILRGRRDLLANRLHSQLEEHSAYGGVVPEIAARAHLEKIGSIVDAALQEAGVAATDIGLVAYTRGPGLMGPLLVGASFARGLALALGVPAAGVNHLEGHIAAAEMSDERLQAPYLALTVSGGHTEITRVDPGFRYSLMGRTRDDAAGEAFDKCGKLLGLGYPAGPLVSRAAKSGQRDFAHFPRSLKGEQTMDFSFSGLKTAVLRYTQSHPPEFLSEHLADICASLEEAIVDMLVERSLRALAESGLDKLAVCGGVSANPRLRERLMAEGARRGALVVFPQMSLCTDNGAMIAGAAASRWEQGLLELSALPTVPGLALANC
jgi:N6-L-threonylcarbamoyladenine synthase